MPQFLVRYTLGGIALCIPMPSKLSAYTLRETLRRVAATDIRIITVTRTL